MHRYSRHYLYLYLYHITTIALTSVIFLIKNNLKKVDTILLHNQNDLLSVNGKSIYIALLMLKKEKIMLNLGVSFYDTLILKKVLNKYNQLFQVAVMVCLGCDRRSQYLVQLLPYKLMSKICGPQE